MNTAHQFHNPLLSPKNPPGPHSSAERPVWISSGGWGKLLGKKKLQPLNKIWTDISNCLITVYSQINIDMLEAEYKIKLFLF